uniref:acetyl-coenzyme A synthetase, cytoplasmic n=1 Tax=Myxine glutinosa TaxID=7769 RepID=UPI00358F1A3D
MSDVYEASAEARSSAFLRSLPEYQALYERSLEDPQELWGELAKQFHWQTPSTGPFMTSNLNPARGRVSVTCMAGATTNVCYNLLDHNIKENRLGDKVAIYWEGNCLGDSRKLTYQQLLNDTCRMSNVLTNQGVKKGDRVAVYMPMIPELVITLLACSRIGAIHSVVFAGFSADSLAERIMDAQCCLLVTADGFFRGEKIINLKQIADDALDKCREREKESKGFSEPKCIVVRHLGVAPGEPGVPNRPYTPAKRPCPNLQTPWQDGRDLWWHEVMHKAHHEAQPVWCDAEDPLFILYTSGSTGKPKGMVHTQAGYLLHTAVSHRLVFDLRPSDVYWCTADIGWITGHSYLVYGPLANGATCLLFEGIPTYPEVDRFWRIIDKYQVTLFYTAPTAIRSLMKHGNNPVLRHSRRSLRVLGSVGEPINPEAWHWYHGVVGGGRCPIVDTYWQTETGGFLLAPMPFATPLKPGSATFPFFGVVPAILNEHGEEMKGEAEGYLVFKQAWPGMARTIYGDHRRYEETYFQKFPGFYFTGDGCRRDSDGYYWVTGRVDDLLNMSGHLLSTAEVEAALGAHPAVVEAATVSCPHSLKGQTLYCFVTLHVGHTFSRVLVTELREKVREKIGPIATPDYIQNAPALPKTRSGKIMRRILRKIASGDPDFGDITTLADPCVPNELFADRCQTMM